MTTPLCSLHALRQLIAGDIRTLVVLRTSNVRRVINRAGRAYSGEATGFGVWWVKSRRRAFAGPSMMRRRKARFYGGMTSIPETRSLCVHAFRRRADTQRHFRDR